MNNDINKLIKFFLTKKDYYQYAMISYETSENKIDNLNACLSELQQLGIIITSYTKKGETKYLIKEEFRKELENIKDPYQHILDKINAENSLDKMSKWYDTENAKSQFEDYPKMKNIAKASIFISALSVVISAIALMKGCS